MCGPQKVPLEESAETNKSPSLTIPVRLSRATARNPRKVLIGSLVSATILSFIAIYVGEFKIEVDNKGWLSRGTTISDRQMQRDVVHKNRNDLFEDTDGSVWEKLKTENSLGFSDIEDKDDNDGQRSRRRLLDSATNVQNHVMKNLDSTAKIITAKNEVISHRALNDVCALSWYDDYRAIVQSDNLFAMWKAQPEEESTSLSILDIEIMSKICAAETNTLKVLGDANICDKCGDGNTSCSPPHSLTYLLRVKLNMTDSSCDELMNAYAPVKDGFVNDLVTCTKEYIQNFDKSSLLPGDSSNCPLPSFSPSLVDVDFGKGSKKQLRYTSSYFRTSDSSFFDGTDEVMQHTAMYGFYPDFDVSDGVTVIGTYDTTNESLSQIKVDLLVTSDMTLAIASLIITFIAMIIHTKSPWLTFLGILQIIFGVPLSYFVYVFIAGLDFFPFLNFIGVFVAAALGADDLFVAVDKFKNARIQNPTGSTEDIAAVAFPDAASAMLLTTSTTAVAFFATCICPVPPILCFAVYCGLMIIFNYIMNILLVFPGLCLYDIWLRNGSKNCCVNICGRKAVEEEDSEDLDIVEDPEHEEPMKISLIHRILSAYYTFIHRFRWIVLAASFVAIALCVYISSMLSQPKNTEVRLLPSSDPFESHFLWQNFILYEALFQSGAKIELIFGLQQGDTGPQNKPDILTKLLLDDTFNPRTEESQLHLQGFCDRLFEESFASSPSTGYKCVINEFDSWLAEQSTSASPTDNYANNCAGSSALPVPEEVFDPCIIAWSKLVDNRDVLQENGVVKILIMEAESNISYRDPIPMIQIQWNYFEDFVKAYTAEAPAGVNNPMHVSQLWWWFDTNQQMFLTAIGAAGIAIGFSAIIVLIASRSLVLMLFSEACILYVLAAATATLVAFGWELGFLESVCFAILVGISCDFIIHFGHAYIHYEGAVAKEVRTKYAVVHMGPSILAAAVTTFSASIVMMFCQVVFFTKFAMILMVTIFQATIGSFVIFITLNDTFGPSEPTKFIDSLVARISGKDAGKNNQDTNDLVLTPEKNVEQSEMN